MESTLPTRLRRLREPFSSASHFVAALLSAGGLIVLLFLARGKPWHIAGYAVFGASLILTFSASALYHGVQTSPRRIDSLKRCDHGAIFLLIAGTFAPVCLIVLRDTVGWTLLATEYVAAGIGITIILFFRNHREWVRVSLYLAMGWMAVVALPHLYARAPHAALTWLVAGGVCYTVGTVVFATERPRLWPGRFGAHDLWHLFVIAGGACHFALMCCMLRVA